MSSSRNIRQVTKCNVNLNRCNIEALVTDLTEYISNVELSVRYQLNELIYNLKFFLNKESLITKNHLLITIYNINFYNTSKSLVSQYSKNILTQNYNLYSFDDVINIVHGLIITSDIYTILMNGIPENQKEV